VTSPPYDLVDEDLVTHSDNGLRDYQGYEWDFVSVAKQLWRVTKKGGVVVWVVGDATVNGSETGSSFRQALYFKGLGFRLHDTMIYQTNRPPFNDRRYEQEFDFMFVFSKNTLNTFTGIQSPVSNATKIRRKTPHIKGYNKYPNGNTVIKRAPNKTSRLIGNIWFYRPKTHQIKTGHPATSYLGPTPAT
jgi:site-specific DNA-methyltransferase (adenine-specific)